MAERGEEGPCFLRFHLRFEDATGTMGTGINVNARCLNWQLRCQ